VARAYLFASAFGIAAGYGLDGRGVGIRVPVGARFYFHVVQTASGAHPATQPVGTGEALSQG
jgi:hypothetical protein